MMVWLAQWIREHQVDARVVIITDRDELDKQITNGFREAGEKPHQAVSGDDLIATLNSSADWLVTTLVHKFGIARNSTVWEIYPPCPFDGVTSMTRTTDIFIKHQNHCVITGAHVGCKRTNWQYQKC